MSHEKNETLSLQIDFSKLKEISSLTEEVLPCAVQNADTKEVLNVAYVNRKALEHSFKTGNATFWSTSRNELWIKGATSGDELKIEDIRVNCEQNSLLYRVRLVGKGACHTKDGSGISRRSCYYRQITESTELSFVQR